MRALLSHHAGGPDTLGVADVADPTPGDGEVVVNIAACGINYPDTLIIEDRYQYKPPRPFAPGAEIAGTVHSVGPGVEGLTAGARVMAMCGWGGLAERIAVDAATCIDMPDAMPFDEGAAFIMTYGTSYHALVQRAQIRAGETVLILGSAGGVGLAAVQIAKALGATVIAAASSQAKLDTAMANGADRGFVYPRDGIEPSALARLIKDHCGPGGADIVYDPVGGSLTEAATRALAWNGRLLVVGFPAGIARLPLNLLLLKGASAVGVFYGSFVEKEPLVSRDNNHALLDLYSRGQVRAVISARFPLARAGDAIGELARGGTQGKLVVEIDRTL